MKNSGIFFFLLCIFSISSFPQNAAFIGFGDDTESQAAFTLLKKSFPSAVSIRPAEISEKYSLLWIHSADTAGIIISGNDITKLKEYVVSGGSLFLTLEAFRLLYALGFESLNSEVKYVKAEDEGYGRKLGLHAFIFHPVFKGLNGGAYIWNPAKDTVTRMHGYFDDKPVSGKTVAVDWAYIRLRENSKIMLEYNPGKGRVLAVGAYTHFAAENNHSVHLEKFLSNCFSYLLRQDENEKKYYWDYRTPFVAEGNDLEFTNANASFVWKEQQTLNLKSNFASSNYWDLAGERILVMGKEKGGIDEIWIHPFMAFRDYEVGLQFSYKDTIYWLNDQRPQIEVSPSYLKRVYKFRRAFLTEIISADPAEPSGVIHYEYRGVFPAKMIVKVKSNLRFMWPYSELVFRGLTYSDREGSIIFSTDGGDLSSVISVNRNPVFSLAGQFEGFDKKDSLFMGKTTSDHVLSVIKIFDLKMNDNLDVSFSGSSISKNESLEAIKKASSAPYEIYKRSVDYADKFFDDKLWFESPDSILNEGMKWAMIGSDKFFVNTPGIGKSLTAGYSTTARGWDGEHKVNGRPGYGWYFGRDAQWSAFALLDYGDFYKVKEILNTFNKFQDITGKIYHELTTSGAVHYDAADATPLYLILAGRYLRFSGDLEFIKNSIEHINRAMDYLYSTDTDGDNLIENTNVGHGWVEGGSLYGAHTTLYLASCWAEALKEAAYISDKFGLKEQKEKYFSDYQKVRNIINSGYWNEKDNFYYYGKFADGTYNPEKTILPSIPLYFRHADSVKAAYLLNHYAAADFTSDWGVRILSSKSPLFNPSGYHYGSVWPLFTGWTSLAEYQYGNYIQGYSHMMNNLKVYQNFSKGYVEEVLNGSIYKPSGVCPHQCWSETMVLQPLIEGTLGLESDYFDNTLIFSPKFPADWRSASGRNIPAGKKKISFTMHKSEGRIIWNFKSSEGGIKLKFKPALPLLSDISGVTLNGRSIDYSFSEGLQNVLLETSFELSESLELIIYLKEGVAVLPFINNPAEGESSTGLRIISTEIKSGRLIAIVEGKSLTEQNLSIYSPSYRVTSSAYSVNLVSNNIYAVRITFNESGDYIRKRVELDLE